MQLFWQIVVWLCIGAVFYTYLGYPALMYLLAKLRAFYKQRFQPQPCRNELERDDWPVISFLIPAYNEQQVIRQKVENTLELDYPQDRLKIVVVSDGSTDLTNAMLNSYGRQEIEFIPMSARRGKTTVLNQVIPRLTGDIVVLSDASGLLKPDALKKLVRHFGDPKVGCVSGVYVFGADDESLRSLTEKVYWQYETFLKQQESGVHSAIGAHGALYGFRRRLFKPFHENTINDDFILPMRIIRKGYRVLYEPEAVVYEIASTNLKGEFNRRIRINVGNFQQTFMLRSLLHPKRGRIALQFFSHKVLRTISPFFIVLLPLACSLAQTPFYKSLLWLQVGFYLIGLLGYLQEFIGIRLPYLYLPFYFLMGNISAVYGLMRFLMHKQSILWKKA
jgi:cellulose synthase/poly-beta-1,6-N-acetylglucosamine synthase-like glycosyltransferase